MGRIVSHTGAKCVTSCELTELVTFICKTHLRKAPTLKLKVKKIKVV